MSIALRVSEIAKQYRIYERPGDRLKEVLTRNLLRRHREFWALRDISFEVERGTTTGIIGPNGSGKSTLLQIIAGTLEATRGEVVCDGRIAALLELGAGFNLEFTGLENVYMNAALLGFSRRDIERRLPEIERFAEIGDFLHQPVKTYSSGMYVRLAFAIAIHAEPELLIVDEALAVGDAVFQHRCLRRIKEMQTRGTTILFVSHDTAAIRALCGRAILLSAGRMVADGKAADVLNHYQKLIMEREEVYAANLPASEGVNSSAGEIDAEGENWPALRYTFRHGDRRAEILGAALLDESRRPVEVVETGAPVLLQMHVLFHRPVERPVFGFLIRNRHDIHVYGTNTEQQQLTFESVRAGEVVEVTFGFQCWLGIDQYSFALAVHSSAYSADGVGHDWIDGTLFFRVTSAKLIEGLVNLNATATMRRTATQASIPAAVPAGR